MSGKQMLLVVAMVLPIFFFFEGPIWRHPFAIDASILWSYVPIPILVFLALLWLRKLSWTGFFVSTLCVTVIKYGITITIACLFWVAYGPPPAPKPRPTSAVASMLSSRPADAPRPSEIPESERGTIEGRVVDQEGNPIPGALIYISHGLEGFVFESPESPVEITDDGHGFSPPIAVARERQPLAFRSVDHQLHTVLATAEGGAPVFNHPLVAGWAPTEFTAGRPLGWLRLRCTVHRDQENGGLLILGHPFFARTGPDGTFRFERVPKGMLELTAHAEDGVIMKAEIVLEPGARKTATLGEK